MMVWFWGVNLWVFMQSNVNYAKIFDLDQNHLSYREIWRVYVLSLYIEHLLYLYVDLLVLTSICSVLPG